MLSDRYYAFANANHYINVKYLVPSSKTGAPSTETPSIETKAYVIYASQHNFMSENIQYLIFWQSHDGEFHTIRLLACLNMAVI